MLGFFKRALHKDSRVAVARDGDRMGIARVSHHGEGRPAVAGCGFRIGDDAGGWVHRAATRVPDLDLRKVPASLVLSDADYQLLMVETPNVPAEELAGAIRWRIKDLIDFPVEDAVLEIFAMPKHANAGSKAMSHAVVARRETVLRAVEQMRQQEFSLDVIDIPELCLRNIATRLPEDEAGLAFLHFTEECSHLVVTRQGTLYLTRRIETGRGALRDAEALPDLAAGIALEVQRSLDYYESHFDSRPIADLVLGPGAHLDELARELPAHLELSVSLLDLQEIAVPQHELSAEEAGVCLLAIGAALRDGAHASQAVAA